MGEQQAIPMCSCGLHASTSRRRLGLLHSAAQRTGFPELSVGSGRGALVFGDGPLLPARLAKCGFSPVICLGYSPLNAIVVERFSAANGLSHVIHIATPPAEISTQNEHPEKRRRLMTELGSSEDFQWSRLADLLSQEYPKHTWEVFAEPWFDDLCEDWPLLHYTRFAEMYGNLLDVIPKSDSSIDRCTFIVVAVAFSCEALWQRLRPLSPGGSVVSHSGLDLSEINALHPGAPNEGHSVDVWPWFAAGALKLVSAPVDVIELSPSAVSKRGDSIQGSGLLQLFSAHDVAAHGVILWLRRKHAWPEDIDWSQAWVHP